MLVAEYVKNLSSAKHYLGRDSFNYLSELSRENDEVAVYTEEFLLLTENKTNSYLRIRGARLLGENMRWLEENQVMALLPSVLALLTDDKPIVVRKVLETLVIITSTCPKTSPVIAKYLETYSYTKYSDAMIPMIEQDIARVRASLTV